MDGVNARSIGDDSAVVELTENELVGEGSRRYCYRHPGNQDLCIKIPKNSKNGLLQQKREIKYFRNLEQRGVPFKYIPAFRGTVNTSKGVGYLYDVIIDDDGNTSRQMMDYIKQEPGRGEEYLQIFIELENYLFEHLVIFYDLSPYNILCRKRHDGQLEPYIIDGVGDVVRIPILNYSKTLVRQKIRRRWLRMINRFQPRFEWMIDYKFSR